MSFWSSLLNVGARLARNRQVQRAARNLARQGVQAWQNRQQGADADQAHIDTSHASGSARPHSAATSDSRTGGTSHRAALPDHSSDAPLDITYAPSQDGNPDPGEIVWAWVAYEEDPTQGKDRPVLVIAQKNQREIVALMLTSRDRGAGDHTDKHGHRWIDIGTGSWDSKGRPSEVRVDRLITLEADSVRREGGRLAREYFDKVAKATRETHNW